MLLPHAGHDQVELCTPEPTRRRAHTLRLYDAFVAQRSAGKSRGILGRRSAKPAESGASTLANRQPHLASRGHSEWDNSGTRRVVCLAD
jgi:hypothetical protein